MPKETYQGMGDHDLLIHIATKQDGIADDLKKNDTDHETLFKKTDKNSYRIAWHDGGLAFLGILVIVLATVTGVVLS